MMLYTILRGIFKGTPRNIALAGMVLFMFGLCPVVLLAGQEDIFNILSLVFYALAAVSFLLALFKYLSWRASGLPGSLSVLQLDHMSRKETRERLLLNVRETTTYGATQSVVLMPPASGSQRVEVACQTCQQKVHFKVDSLQLRMQKRLRTLLIWGGSLVVSIALGIVSTYAGQATHMAWWVYLVWWCHTILFVYSAFKIFTLFPYIGAKAVSVPPGHQIRFPEKNELVHLYQNARYGADVV